MDIAEIDQLVRWMEEAGIASLSIGGPEHGLKITLETAAIAGQPATIVTVPGLQYAVSGNASMIAARLARDGYQPVVARHP